MLVCIKKVQSVALLLVRNEDRSPLVWNGKKGVTRLLQTLAGIVCPPSSITVGPSSISTHRQPRRGIDWSVSGLLTMDLRFYVLRQLNKLPKSLPFLIVIPHTGHPSLKNAF